MEWVTPGLPRNPWDILDVIDRAHTHPSVRAVNYIRPIPNLIEIWNIRHMVTPGDAEDVILIELTHTLACR